ncbi:hypothetical protein WJX77_000773 [Trebouxia sp. C0004]
MPCLKPEKIKAARVCGQRLTCSRFGPTKTQEARHTVGDRHTSLSARVNESKHPSHGFSLFLEQQAICMKLLKVDNRLSPRCPSPETFFESVA